MNHSATYLLAALREKIKEKGIGYSDLSLKMGIPLSTIKRKLHNTALGLDKILLYASYLDTDLVELSMRGKQLQQESEQVITGLNGEIFYRYPHLFDFLNLLRINDSSLDEIAQAYQLNQTSVTLYLRALEMLGYLVLKGDRQYQFTGKGRFVFDQGSPLEILFANRFMHDAFSQDVNMPICIDRISITEEQEEKLLAEVHNKLLEFDIKNKSSETTPRLRNVLMTFTPGNQVFLSKTIHNIDSELLKEISFEKKTESN
ncbi:transcriptional regulator [Photobacterium aquae]|uniref:Transcriptional regulator n=1 Tax=Photobacterium aquae TaxID=1195763 RepID=A0A0J1HD11_9GAMM|nr:helix-turn-helix transcriptional regulator [Photobacterium aquae]KLV09528.1 transcriptional regulator [Photobacterium aquae]